jgi:hypothetical protein
VAKMALIERELKRDKLVAKYAKKHAELKGIANDAKRSDDERAVARLALQKLPRDSATAAPLPGARAAPSSTSVWHGPRSAKWPWPAKYPASSRPAGKP